MDEQFGSHLVEGNGPQEFTMSYNNNCGKIGQNFFYQHRPPSTFSDMGSFPNSSSLAYFPNDFNNNDPTMMTSCGGINNNQIPSSSVYCFGNDNNYCGQMIGNHFVENRAPVALPLPLIGNRHNQHNCNYILHANNNNNNSTMMATCNYSQNNGGISCFNRNRYMPYNHNRSCAAAAAAATATAVNGINYPGLNSYGLQQLTPIFPPNIVASSSSATITSLVRSNSNELAAAITANVQKMNCENSAGKNESEFDSLPISVPQSATSLSSSSSSASSSSLSSLACFAQNHCNGQSTTNHVDSTNQSVTLQISNLDYSMDETSQRSFLLSQLKSVAPVLSLVFEGNSYAKVTVPDSHFAKQVISYLHRKKVGHKRMVVSYTKDSSLSEFNTLRCQVAGLLKDVPNHTLPMYKFRELFQSRFKTSISVLDLYKMSDICNITTSNDENLEEKYISLQPDLIASLENSPLIEGLQHSVPYCIIHFKREDDKGWAEQEIGPLPNVFMTIKEIKQIIYALLKLHRGDIPIASLVHCIESELKMKISPNDAGVNLEHLICCVQGIQIQMNKFGIKILGWMKYPDNQNSLKEFKCSTNSNSASCGGGGGIGGDPLHQISREVIELLKMSPKSTMKFNRFIPAYHNHFGKQLRVADYGYTKLIELFEALSPVIQIIGDGENRQITLAHRTQIRRFTSDLLRILRSHPNKSILLSQLPIIFTQIQKRKFDITDYGVCDIADILDGLDNSNIVVLTRIDNNHDILITMPKRKQTNSEMENTSIFAGEVVDLLRMAPQYSILFQKFVRSYHYHFTYQCRLSDYGFVKLTDLMDAIHGVVVMQIATNDEDKKIVLTPTMARRVFAEQIKEHICELTGSSMTPMRLDEVLDLHKNKFGYQIQASILGAEEISEAVQHLPYIEVIKNNECLWISCHLDDENFRKMSYRSCMLILSLMQKQNIKDPQVPLNIFMKSFNAKHNQILSEKEIFAMKHAIEIVIVEKEKLVRITNYMKFIMSIVWLLKANHGSMILSEIKNVLNADIAKCSEFGYPNLLSMLRAYRDLFEINQKFSHDRNEVNLVPQNELLLHGSSHSNFFESMKLPSSVKHKSSAPRIPLSELSNLGSPVAKQKKIQRINSLVEMQASHIRQQPLPQSKSNRFGRNFPSISSSSSLPTGSSDIQNNKENSFSCGTFNGSLNSSTSSDFNSSFGSNITRRSPKMWECASQFNNSFGYNNLSQNYWNEPNGGAILNSAQFMEPIFMSGMNFPDNRHQNHFDCATYNGCATAEITPYWMDPIWTNNNNNNINGNIQPEAMNKSPLKLKMFSDLKILSEFPDLLSPYTISKIENMKKRMFNFDKKIT